MAVSRVRIPDGLRGWLSGAGRSIVVSAVLLLAVPFGAAAQGTISGQVLDAATSQPVSSVQVYIRALNLGALSQANGRYVLSVPAGRYTILAQRIGYATAEQIVTVVEGGTVTIDFPLAEVVLAIEGIVATGLIDPVAGVLSPITVNRISRAQIPAVVGGTSAIYNLAGRIPGLEMSQRSGQPGAEVEIMLRSPTSIAQSPRPLIVVDGVILGSGTANIESMDIESMEVIKGAAAASLYGSRAANGVISITTRRGSELAIGQTRFSLRTEFGRSWAYRGGFNDHHFYLVDDPINPTTYVDRNGNPVSREDRVQPAGGASLAFSENNYPGPTFDNFAEMFAGDNFQTQNLSMSQNTENTNFAISTNRMVEAGPLINNDGYERTSFRVNLDHRFLDNFQLGVSSFYSRDNLDVPKVNWSTLLLAPPDVDVTAKDANGEFVRLPDAQVAYENPLWREESRERDQTRGRTLASANLRWDPASWITLSTNVSYDREDVEERTYVPRGTPLSVTRVNLSDGSLDFETSRREAFNSEATVSLRRDFLDGGLNVRTTFRGLLESDQFSLSLAEGEDFLVSATPSLDVARTFDGSSVEEDIRAMGYLWDTALDYEGKYIFTGLVRRDGSSLFGPADRWHTYYRTAAAWRLGEEDWFDLPNVSEFKLSYALGTAGGRPEFEYRYETWRVRSGVVSKGTLGNTALAPEHTTEQEVSLEMILYDRIGVDLTRAWHRTTNQIVEAALPAYTGYAFQWTNAGTVVGQSWELSIEAQLVRRPNFSWTSALTWDRSDGEIEEWTVASDRPGHRNWQTGETIWGLHGTWVAAAPGVLCADTWTAPIRATNDGHGGVHDGAAACSRADEFMLNDENWLVWVGEDPATGERNHYTEGFSENLWGTTTQIGNNVYEWGIPFYWLNDGGSPRREQLGDAARNNFGLANTFQFGNWTLFTHLHAVFGVEVVDGYHRRLVDFHPRQDMFGRPDELKKPARHWWALAGGGGAMHVERADFFKLRLLSLSYNVPGGVLDGIGLGAAETMRLGVIGRNLFMFTNCPCPDPEMGFEFQDRSGSITRGYPATRNLTIEVEVTF
jgi:TonB-linked SusC/RagA family outer membrane protein